MNKEEFKAIRKELGRTQAEIGVQLGVTVRTISRYEAGEYPIPHWIGDRMEGDTIKEKNRIVYDPEMVTLEEIINSYDKVNCIYLETDNGSFIVIIAAEILENTVVIKNYMQGIYPNQTGRYICDGVTTEHKGSTLQNNMIHRHLEDACFKVNYAAIHGISFEQHIKKPL